MAQHPKESNKLLPIILGILVIFAMWYFFTGTRISDLQHIKNLHAQSVIAMRICLSSPLKNPEICPVTENTLDGSLQHIKEQYIENSDLSDVGTIEYIGNVTYDKSPDEYQNPRIALKLKDGYDSSCTWTLESKTGMVINKEVTGDFPEELCEQ